MHEHQTYVRWLRASGPYVNAHRGRTFVVECCGDAIASEAFPHLVQDLGLLHSLGVKLVFAYGVGPQLDRQLAERGHPLRNQNGARLADEAAMTIAKQIIGALHLEIEAQLSLGLPNSPLAGSRIPVVSGNFVTARPLGIRDGIDYLYCGETRRIDRHSIEEHLASGAIVLVAPLGFSPTGETFLLDSTALATALAIELNASKLLLLADGADLSDDSGQRVGQLTLKEAKERLAQSRDAAVTAHLDNAIRACLNGVGRVHLLDWQTEGALLLELFTRDGVGTMINADPYDSARRATIEDVGGILELIEPLERSGHLVRRSREKLETEINRFHIMERDGAIIACAAIHPFEDASGVELACLAVHPDYQKQGRADAMLRAVERDAEHLDATCVFVLTTHATHWFKERGFEDSSLDALPVKRQALFNYSRNSRVLVKALPQR